MSVAEALSNGTESKIIRLSSSTACRHRIYNKMGKNANREEADAVQPPTISAGDIDRGIVPPMAKRRLSQRQQQLVRTQSHHINAHIRRSLLHVIIRL